MELIEFRRQQLLQALSQLHESIALIQDLLEKIPNYYTLMNTVTHRLIPKKQGI